MFHIRAQNAGLLFTGRADDIVVEAFELLAPNKDVMSCQGRLLRKFPDCAVAVDRAVVFDSQFLDEFSRILCQLELEACPLARPQTTKSGKQFDEERDTDSPFLVTGWVISTLAGLGRSVRLQQVSKRSREQVSWDSARLPFHRSPTWLLLRVALRLVLDRRPSQGAPYSLYKALTAFHHARLLGQARTLGLKSELRFIMEAKIARRILKLDLQQNPPWLQDIRDIIAADHDELQKRWEAAQKDGHAVHASCLKHLQFQPDTNLRLEKLTEHLAWSRSRTLGSQGANGPGDKSTTFMFPPRDFPTFPSGATMQWVDLVELENWIESNLSFWVASRLQNNDSVADIERDLEMLQKIMHHYQAKASGAYVGNPESLSLMYLNLMDLWVALDKVAGKAIPLLLDYDPGFPPGFLHSLILPTRTQMTRLRNIELYLSDRKKAASNGYPLAFANFG